MERTGYDVEKKLQIEFNPEEFTQYQNVFKAIDKDKSGYIDKSEMKNGHRSLEDDDISALFNQLDLNKDSRISFNEFLRYMRALTKSDKEEMITKLTTKTGVNVFRIGGESSSNFSSFSEEERNAFVRVMNTVLVKDPHVQGYLPIENDSMEVFSKLVDGVILCKLINIAQPNTIDERVINMKNNMNVFQIQENLKLALNASKVIGCQLINIYPETIIDQKYSLVLGLLWQLIKIIMLSEVNLKKHPQLIRLLKENEQLSDLLKLSSEDLLLRWFNYHLSNAGYQKKISNFTSDVKDSERYVILLNQLNNQLCDKSALNETDPIKKAQKVLDNAKKLGVESYITPNDIANGNQKLNTLFTAAIFNTCHGLDPPTEAEEYEAAQLLKDDDEGTREERAFRMWINSLGLDNTYVNNLYEDSKSGVLLLRVIDRIKPGTIDWKKIDIESNNKFKKIANCNEVVTASKKAGLKIVGIGGTDINDGNKKLILAIVWQLMRENSLQVLGNKTEEDILNWANSMVSTEYKVNNFKDKTLKTSLFFIHLMSAIEPRAINWDLVYNDDSDESVKNNAQYALSIARKLGASIFLTWEDMKEVKSKMILTFVAALYDVFILETKLRNEKQKIKAEMSLNSGDF